MLRVFRLRHAALAFGLVTLSATSACVEDTAVGPDSAAEPQLPPSTPAEGGLFALYRTMPDAQLADLIEETDERVFIMIKEPRSLGGVDRRGRSLVSAATLRSAKSKLEEMGLEIDWEAKYQPTIATQLPIERLAEVRALPFVDIVEPIGGGSFGFQDQDTLENIIQVEAPNAWFRTKGAGAKLLIIDTGVQSHEDLPTITKANFTNEVDHDTDGHGTAMSGVVAAVDNSIGIIGVSPSVSLHMAKVAATSGFEPGLAQPLAEAIEWGITQGVDVISISLHLENPHVTVTNAINNAYSNHDILLVAAVGQDSIKPDVWYPANLDNVVAVSAVDSQGDSLPDAHHGEELELAAPGEDIESTWKNNNYKVIQGTSTSLATPHVAALAALIKSAHPSWSNVDIRNKLKNTASGGGDVWNEWIGWGIIDAAKALDIPTFSILDDSGNTWQYTDQCFDANVQGAGGYSVNYAWRFDDSGSFTTPSSDALIEFLGHSSAGYPTVTLQATNTGNGSDIFVRQDNHVYSGAVSVDGPDFVTDKVSKTYVSSHSGDWYERWDASDPCDWGLEIRANSTIYNRIWPAGWYTVDLRNTEGPVLRRGRMQVEACWQCPPPGEMQVRSAGTFSASMIHSGVGSDWGIFGAGPWISAGSQYSPELVRFYDLTGQHEPGSPFADAGWIFGTGGVTTDAARRWRVKWSQLDVPDPNIKGYDFTLMPLAGAGYEFGMALDPDLNNPTDDESGFDNGRDLIYVVDGSDALGFLLLDSNGNNALLKANQFGAKRFAPGAKDEAWKAQREPNVKLQDGADDVQLILSTAESSGVQSWTLWMLRGDSVQDIRRLADQVLDEL